MALSIKAKAVTLRMLYTCFKVRSFTCNFSEEGFLVGYKAIAQAEHNPKNTIYDAKRFIGKKYTAEELTQAQKRYPFKASTNNSILEEKESTARSQFVCIRIYEVFL